MATSFSAPDVAAEIRKRLPAVPTKKLHKLLYYCQGHHVAAFDSALFAEGIEAWDRGPVVADLWRAEKYGSAPVAAPRALDEAALNTVGYVVSRYWSMTGADLEKLAHQEPPWLIANERRKLTGQQQIDMAEIKAYFQSQLTYDDFDEAFDSADDNYDPPDRLLAEWLNGARERLADDLRPDDIAALGL